MDRELKREMAITPEEFRRLLPRALGGMSLTGHGLRWEARQGGRRVCIELEACPPRRLASLELPVTRLHMNLTGFAESEERAFLANFDRTYQRGGG